MLKFRVFEDGEPAMVWPLRNAYLVGADGNPMRSEINFDHGIIYCEKREQGTAALALQHRVGDLGELTVQTCLLPDSDAPYLLNLELARHRMMTLLSKQEDWAMLDLPAEHPASKRIERSRKIFIEALCIQKQDPAGCDKLASECLVVALDGSEELALSHSELLLNKRKQAHALPKMPIGCGVGLDPVFERVRPGLPTYFDSLMIPTPWKTLAPEEGEYHWQKLDGWMNWVGQHRVPVIAGPLVCFEPGNLPDWLYIWEHDYDTVRDLIYEYIERVVTRYGHAVSMWNAASGLHVNGHFSFSFDQIMDLTRMSIMLIRKMQPSSKVLVELRQPFGEYYGSNPRSIPPMTYADLIADSGLNFDGFALRLPMGQSVSGQYTRDLMQLSHMLDQFSVFNKPLYLSIAAPSEPVTQLMIAVPDSDVPVDDNSGFWRRNWSPVVQSHWVEALLQIALSKPFVEGIYWCDLVDHPQIELPLSGLINEQIQPKGAFRRVAAFRYGLTGRGPAPEPEKVAEGAAKTEDSAAAPGAATATATVEADADEEAAFPHAVDPHTEPELNIVPHESDDEQSGERQRKSRKRKMDF